MSLIKPHDPFGSVDPWDPVVQPITPIPPTHVWPDPLQPNSWPPFSPPDTVSIPSVFGPISQGRSDGSSTDYYKIPVGSTDLIDLIEHKNMNFAIGNIFKACYRLGQKEGNDDAYDLRKIIFFAERELARIGQKK